MHFENTNGMNSNAKSIPTTSATTTTTTASCPSTSSSDSGVIIIDNQTTINARNNNTSNRNNNSNNNNTNNNANNINIDSATTTTTTTSAKTTRNDEKQFNETENNRKSFNINKNVENNLKKSSHINIENTINIGNSSRDADSNSNKSNSGSSSSGSSNRGPFNDNTRTATTSKNYSPTVSVRSTTISIVSIDENAPDSSIVDSDSDIEADAEGVHSNYIVKKLGQQTTYPANSPDIPALNKGLTVIGQKITPNGTAGAIDDVLASNIRNGGLCAPSSAMAMASGGLTPTTPQIGSIALSNSTDVTFGDKHFYEGPVTIQQFLIDNGRDKWKANDSETGGGQDNPAFGPEQNAKDGSCGAGANGGSDGLNERPYKFIFHRKAVIITGTIIILTILVGICIVIGTNLSKSSIPKSKLPGDGDDLRKHIPINSNIDKDNIGGGSFLRIVARDAWLAQPPNKELVPLDLPVPNVIVLPTNTDICTTQASCTFRVRFTQTFNIESLQNDDIIYNFLIGGDGNVYEGRGWDKEGAHLKGFNDHSISVAYIGTFKLQKPTDKQMNVTKLLLSAGVAEGKLQKDYKIYGANNLDPSAIGTVAPALYASFKDWPHWTEKT